MSVSSTVFLTPLSSPAQMQTSASTALSDVTATLAPATSSQSTPSGSLSASPALNTPTSTETAATVREVCRTCLAPDDLNFFGYCRKQCQELARFFIDTSLIRMCSEDQINTLGAVTRFYKMKSSKPTEYFVIFKNAEAIEQTVVKKMIKPFQNPWGKEAISKIELFYCRSTCKRVSFVFPFEHLRTRKRTRNSEGCCSWTNLGKKPVKKLARSRPSVMTTASPSAIPGSLSVPPVILSAPTLTKTAATVQEVCRSCSEISDLNFFGYCRRQCEITARFFFDTSLIRMCSEDQIIHFNYKIGCKMAVYKIISSNPKEYYLVFKTAEAIEQTVAKELLKPFKNPWGKEDISKIEFFYCKGICTRVTFVFPFMHPRTKKSEGCCLWTKVGRKPVKKLAQSRPSMTTSPTSTLLSSLSAPPVILSAPTLTMTAATAQEVCHTCSETSDLNFFGYCKNPCQKQVSFFIDTSRIRMYSGDQLFLFGDYRRFYKIVSSDPKEYYIIFKTAEAIEQLFSKRNILTPFKNPWGKEAISKIGLSYCRLKCNRVTFTFPFKQPLSQRTEGCCSWKLGKLSENTSEQSISAASISSSTSLPTVPLSRPISRKRKAPSDNTNTGLEKHLRSETAAASLSPSSSSSDSAARASALSTRSKDTAHRSQGRENAPSTIITSLAYTAPAAHATGTATTTFALASSSSSATIPAIATATATTTTATTATNSATLLDLAEIASSVLRIRGK